MRSFAILAAIFGVALLTGLTVYYGFDEVMAAIASSRWATALVVAARAAALVGAGIGWWALVPGREWGPSAFVLLRFVREGLNTFFPLAVIGGDVIGARLLAQFGVATKLAVASVLVDVFIQVACLIVFVLAGGGIVAGGGCNRTRNPAAVGLLGVSVPAGYRVFPHTEFRRVRTGGALAYGVRRKTPMAYLRPCGRSGCAVAADLAQPSRAF